jgi:membrane-bound serine protease (ClpP class)
MKVSLSVILGFAIPMAMLSIFILRFVFRMHTARAQTGQSGMVGEKGEAQSVITKEQEGKVYVHGELWNAVSEEEIQKGEKVIVDQVDGMILKVKKEVKGV